MAIKVDHAAMQEVFRALSHIRNGASTATMRALNHTLDKTRTSANSAIREQVALPASYVKERLRPKKATKNNLSARLEAMRRGVLLSRYQNRDLKVGVSVKVKPGPGQTKKMPGAFYITFANGVRAIAIRTQRGPGLGRSEGLKLLHGPSVSQVYTDVKDDMTQPSGRLLLERMAHEAARLLDSQG